MTLRPTTLIGFEYFWQKEAENQFMSKAPCGPASVSREDQQGGFSLHGHRLSSLYRVLNMAALSLMRGYQINGFGFFLPKILNPDRSTLRSARL